MAERARARAFLDLLGSRESRPGPREAPILDETLQPASDLRRGETRENSGIPVVDADVLRGHDRDQEGFKRFVVRETGPSSLIAIDAPTLAQVKEEARSRHTAVLEYFAADEALLTWLVGPDGSVRSARSAISRRELSELVSKMRGAPRTPGSRARAHRASRRLYQLLIAPIEAFLPEDPEEIVTIVPHGPLFLVSFAALEDRQGSYLVERHTLAYSPSVGVLRYTEKNRHPASESSAPRVLLVGNPRMPDLPRIGLPPLPGAEKEAHAIGRLFPANQVTILTGARAAEPVIRRLAPAQRVIHLATHARVYDDEPLESFLTLASSRSATARRGGLGSSDLDGVWTVREVFELELHSDLVTLSACNTGLGRVTGDGVTGLSRAFLYAGTPSVLVSLWEVADILAGPQMEGFYRRLRDNGGNKAAALRTAQLTTLRGLRRWP